MSPATQTMVQVIRSDFDTKGGTWKPRIEDYITVPRLTTHGTFRFQELMSFEDLGKLAGFYYKLEKGNV